MVSVACFVASAAYTFVVGKCLRAVVDPGHEGVFQKCFQAKLKQKEAIALIKGYFEPVAAAYAEAVRRHEQESTNFLRSELEAAKGELELHKVAAMDLKTEVKELERQLACEKERARGGSKKRSVAIGEGPAASPAKTAKTEDLD